MSVDDKRLQETHHFDWYVPCELAWEDPWKETRVLGVGEQILINALMEIVQEKKGRGIILLASRGSGKTVASYRCEHLLASESTSRAIFGGSRPLVLRWAKSNWPTTAADKLIDMVVADSKFSEFLKLKNGLGDASHVCRSIAEYALKEQRLVIIIDAYDELDANQKASLRTVHNRALQEDKRVLWIITSRDYAVHEELGSFFKEDVFRRLRIQPFSRRLQNQFMERALRPMVKSWRKDCFKDSAEDWDAEDWVIEPWDSEDWDIEHWDAEDWKPSVWDKQLGTPLTLRQVAVMINESTSTGSKTPSFSSLSDLFVQSSDRLIEREFHEHDVNQEKAKIGGRPQHLSLRREYLERALGAIAFELAVRGIWKEVVGTSVQIAKVIAAAKKRYLLGCKESKLDARVNSESSWEWAYARIGEFEINNGVLQADINKEVLSFTTRHVQEMRCARYLSKYATAEDLRNATNQVHCALGHNGDESWEDVWKGIIKIPVDTSSDDEPGRYLEILKVLFERPTENDQRRPTKLMWEAQEWLGRKAGLKNLIPRLHAHLVRQYQSIKQQPEYQSAINELLDPARYVLLRCGDEPVLDKDTGVFTMGPDDDDIDRTDKVTLTQRFGICKYQMTREQFSIWDNLPSKEESNLPAIEISWLDCYFMLVGLSAERVIFTDGREYQFTFPTEAQWEYSCRAGSTTAYCFGDDENELSEYAWYDKNSEGREHPVGMKKANGWGLYDMHGNVWEWCWDWYGRYPKECATDPLGPDEGSDRSYRGGGWFNAAAFCRSASRYWGSPEDRDNYLGFRLALRSTGIPKSPEAGKSSGAGGS
jgi:hypothetical protein